MTKSVKYIFAILFALSAIESPCQKKEKEVYLELSGSIKEEKKGIAEASIIVYVDNSEFKSVATDKKGKFKIQLPLDRKYLIKFSKDGYVSKIITINTNLPPDEKAVYIFPLTVDLFKEIVNLDVSILKEPIAKINYNSFNKQFDYDYNYTAKINQDLKDLYDRYSKLQTPTVESQKK